MLVPISACTFGWVNWRREEADRDLRLLLVVGGSRGGNITASEKMELDGCAGCCKKGRFSFIEVKVGMFTVVEGWRRAGRDAVYHKWYNIKFTLVLTKTGLFP